MKIERNEFTKAVYELYNLFYDKIKKNQELKQLFSEEVIKLFELFEQGAVLESEEVQYGA
ncbi:MAG: hypothetical protein QXO33_03460 [Nitrososphaeria archaeon]